MTYLRISDVDVYSEVLGTGEPLLLLHGGFCSLFHLQPFADGLSERFTVAAYERPGHGRTADIDGPYSHDISTAEAVAYLDALGLDRVHVLGFSDGAILGLLLALRHPDRVRSLVSISGNLDPSVFTTTADTTWPRPEASDQPSAERIHYEALSPDGPEHANVVLDKLFTLWATEPAIAPADLAAVTAPVLVVSGDRDTIPVEHSHLIARSLPNGQLCIVPGATHGLVSEKPAVLTAIIRDFHDRLVAISR